MAEIGRLIEVDVRELWKHEQYDFSNWLAKESNIEYLNEILGLTLIEVDKEINVGPYRCDIVATDETSGLKVIIENQLESTNHDHLGKIITYASGLDAKVIVWIVKEAKEEHRAAIEWLNNYTSSEIDFFLIEIHAYKIGGSNPAPKFEVVEKPNDFVKRSKNKDDGELNTSQTERLIFWTQFNEKILSKGKPFNLRKPTTDHWYDVAIGTSAAKIAVDLVNKENCIILELYIHSDKKLYDSLFEKKNEIEGELDMNFEWDRLDSKKASRIKHSIHGLDFYNHSNYDQLMDEVIDKVIRMRKVFQKYIA
ncbi:DUF4268 domain-containing protein [Solobacterium moorei]|uniref:DUF4268 domain-containing protein n=1 Tax=Solobacterium moorei TaxID=102148 RepID=UPI0023F258C9|nr:DUF4268 domain-containing protein [Solobacterium moorei]